jgi:hypothetical protein
MFPESMGGMGPKWVEAGITIEEMSKECNTLACAMAGIFAGASMLTMVCNDELTEKILQPVIRARCSGRPQCGPPAWRGWTILSRAPTSSPMAASSSTAERFFAPAPGKRITTP